MNSKLTLKLSSEVINRAKLYAKERGVSLSKLVEAYLDSISDKEEGELTLSPLIEGLVGVIKLPENYDYKKERGDALEKKHS